MAGKKRGKKRGRGAKKHEPIEPRNTALADALQTGDVAAVAFALRHGPTVVPIVEAGSDAEDADEVWTYRDPKTGDVALLLFSDATHRPGTLPSQVAVKSPAWLREFLSTQEDAITTVFLDVAGPHPMQASPADLIAALDA